jgi:CMP-N-acetylneuraminic acid synthetase
MYKKKKILVVIPARGGSKGIRDKNLKKIGKKSLIEITANVLNRINLIDCSMISTDSLKIAKEAKKFGLKFFKKRAKNLSGHKVGDAPVLKDALYIAEKKMNMKFDIILMCQVTSPLRKMKDIIGCIKLIINKNFNSVWSISKVDRKFHPLKQLKLIKNDLYYFNSYGSKIIARQQLNDTYIRNGAIYAFTRKSIQSMNLLPKKSGAIVLKSKQVSIDTKEDLNYVKRLLV